MKVNKFKIKNIVKLEIIVMILSNIEVIHICNLKYKTTKEICTIFHNKYKYDFHFIIKDLADLEFEGKSTCFGENSEKVHNLFHSNRKIS